MRKYSKAQELYMVAKVQLETLEQIEKNMDEAYTAPLHIINSDGSEATCIIEIEDEALFTLYNEALAALPESKANWAEILEARETLKAAENNLIEWGLAIVARTNPREAKTLLEAVKTNYTTKIKVIDLNMKLDVTTLPKRIAV